MSRDECFYDYLKPSDMWTYNPWAENMHERTPIYTVCDKDAEEAEPLYDSIDGDICLYVKKEYYGKEDYERLEKETGEYIDTDRHTWDGRHRGIPDIATDDNPGKLGVQFAVVENGKLIGAFSHGHYDSNEYMKSNGEEYSRLVYVPLDRTPVMTRFSYTNNGIKRCDYAILAKDMPIYTVCTELAAGAIPLYDKIGGEECLYVKEKFYDVDEYLSLRRLCDDYEVVTVGTTDSSAFHGFAGEMSYDENTKTDTKYFNSDTAVIKNDKLFGSAVVGKWYVRKDDTPADEYKSLIFLPLDGEFRETEYRYALTVYGSDGEEDEYTYSEFKKIQKK